MARVLSIEDFENGRFEIPVNPDQETSLESYIGRVEDMYLPYLFGVDLYILFKTEIDANNGVPSSQRFLDVYNPFLIQLDACYADRIIESKGLKDVLKSIVYFMWTRDLVTRVTTVGIKQTMGENSENMSAIKNDVDIRYNEGIRSFKAIQYYMDEYKEDDYPEYKGVYVGFNHGF